MKLKVSDLKKQLKTYDQKELIQLIADLYKMNKDVQSYLSVQFVGEEATADLFIETKKKIEHEFFPKKGHGQLRLAEAKKAITEFKKLANDPFKTTELMLYYVEQGVKFTTTYGDIDGPFYSSMVTMYVKVIDSCREEEAYYQAFEKRLRKAMIDTDGIGWGFHDQLDELYCEMMWEREEGEE